MRAATDAWNLDASGIEVEVSGNEVTLSGTVDSKEAKRRAEDIADSVSGVSHVQNNLRILTNTNASGNENKSKSTDYSARNRQETMSHN